MEKKRLHYIKRMSINDESISDKIIEIHDVVRDSSESRDDSQRKEQAWTPKLEIRLNNWMEELITNRSKHKKSAIRKKFLYRAMFIPSAVLQVTLGLITPYVKIDDMIYIAIFMCISSMLTTVNGSLDYGSTSTKHLFAEYEMGRLLKNIEYILSQQKKNRDQADVIMTEVRLEMSIIERFAPVV